MLTVSNNVFIFSSGLHKINWCHQRTYWGLINLKHIIGRLNISNIKGDLILISGDCSCFCKTDYTNFSVSGLVKALKSLEIFVHTSNVQMNYRK